MGWKIRVRPDEDTAKKLDAILAGVNLLLTKEAMMATALETLQAQVEKNTEVEASAILLIQGIAQQLKDALAQGDPTKIAELVTALDNSAQALAAAVAANTPTMPA